MLFRSLYQLGAEILVSARRTDEAEAEYRKAASLDPRHEKSRFNLGLLFEKEGRFDEALSQFEAAARIQPGYVRAHLRAAAILEAKGDRPRAREHFQAALKAEPDNAEAREGLRRAQGKP